MPEPDRPQAAHQRQLEDAPQPLRGHPDGAEAAYLLDQGRLRRASTCRCTRRSPTSARCRPCSRPTTIPIALGAQNCHWEEKGAFTGEVSPAMLAKLNVALRDRRPLRAPGAVRRDRRDGATQGAGHPQARDDADPVLRRDARGARGRATPRPRSRARCGPGSPGVTPGAGRRAGHRLRADLGHRHRPHGQRRGRPGGVRARAGHGRPSWRAPTRPPRCASSTAARSSRRTPPS